jgi:uncharacterized protein with HEPN domain
MMLAAGDRQSFDEVACVVNSGMFSAFERKAIFEAIERSFAIMGERTTGTAVAAMLREKHPGVNWVRYLIFAMDIVPDDAAEAVHYAKVMCEP